MCNSGFDVPGHIVPDKAIFCNMLGRELVSNSFHRIILSPFTFKWYSHLKESSYCLDEVFATLFSLFSPCITVV